MKIMSESEFQKCIEDAERRGYEKATHDAYIKQEERDFQNTVWREMREFRREFYDRLERLEKATGNEYAMTKECCCVAPPPGGVIMAGRTYILTLCDSCAETIRIGGFKVKSVVGKATTKKKKTCENCGQRVGGTVKQYIVAGRGR